jgi:uncharacterized membrane protein
MSQVASTPLGLQSTIDTQSTTQPLLTKTDIAVKTRPQEQEMPPPKGSSLANEYFRRAFDLVTSPSSRIFLCTCVPFAIFAIIHLPYINIDSVFCKTNEAGKVVSNSAAPGECYAYGHGSGRVGMFLHLATILPAAILVPLQFVSMLRKKATWFHRYNGWAVFALSCVSMMAVPFIVSTAFGGSLVTQGLMVVMDLLFLGSMALGVFHVRRGRYDKHRAWMTRAWAYVSYYNPLLSPLFPFEKDFAKADDFDLSSREVL